LFRHLPIPERGGHLSAAGGFVKQDILEDPLLATVAGVAEWGQGWAQREAERAAEFVTGYSVGTQLLQWAELSLPLALDAQAGNGNVFRVALEHRRAARPPLDGAASGKWL
jgi:hypothetical protein